MKEIKAFSILILVLLCCVSVYAQDRNNDDEVVKIDPQISRFNSVPGDVIVKFADGTNLQLNGQRGELTTGLANVDAVLRQYNVRNIEKLCPLEQPKERGSRRSTPSYNGPDVPDYDLSRLCIVQIYDSIRTNELIGALNNLEEVEFAEPNFIVYTLENRDNTMSVETPYMTSLHPETRTTTTPNDPMYAQQWGLSATQLPQLWAVDTAYAADGSDRPIIAILDTGVDPEHPDLAANIWHNPNEIANGYDDDGNGFVDDTIGWDFVNQTAAMHDFNSHGTHCAGIAAAVGNNSIGICGANPNALIMPIAVMQSNGTGDVATIIRGVNYAKNMGADVLSMSIGSYSYSIAFEQALAQAYQNATLVAAAGNDGKGMFGCCPYPICLDFFPASLTFVLGVQATASANGGLTGWSNYDCTGPNYSDPLIHTEEQLYNYELSAPGSSIISTIPGGSYRNYNGTSMATPLVAGGISALMHAKNYPSKEMLYGDLINTTTEFNNVHFFDSYQAGPAPAQLQFVTYQMVDSVTGDGDTRIDAGETVQIYPTIRTTWGGTDSITCWIEFSEFEDPNTIHFVNNYVDFGHSLSAYSKSRSVNPIIFTIDSNVVDGRVICLYMCAISPNAQDTMRHYFEISVENGVELRGMLTENTTLYPNTHYIVTDNFGIPSGITLSIKPGTILRFKDNASFMCEGRVIAIGTPDSMITFTKTDLGQGWHGMSFNLTSVGSLPNVFSYCIFEYCQPNASNYRIFSSSVSSEYRNHDLILAHPDNLKKNCYAGKFSDNATVSIENSVIRYCNNGSYPLISNGAVSTPNHIATSNIIENNSYIEFYLRNDNLCSESANNNIINNFSALYGSSYIEINSNYQLHNNVFNNSITDKDAVIRYRNNTSSLTTFNVEDLYFGTSKESILREHVIDFNTPNSGMFYSYDFSNMAKRPNPDAHGIVWKVEVNGYDAQDEFDSIIPLGVGRHRFDVYFNRPMDKEVTPMVAMGVRPPYTQVAIDKDGEWNKRGDIYTVYLDLDATTVTDGLCRIYVANAKDNEHFEIPYENKRFNVQVSAAGSMSAGFMAEGGLGKIDLEWNNNDVNFDDFLGYNMYRYQLDANGNKRDSMLVNTSLIQDTLYTDFNVVPGQRYYYYYRVLRSSLTESDDSKTVSAVPLSSTLGDANGNFTVDVTDVVSTINYITGQNPQPFIFEAADVNSDGVINILDIVSMINLIMHPDATPSRSSCATATYTVENGVLYIDSPVELAGVQLMLNMNSGNQVTPTSVLDGFEKITDWVDDDTYMFMAYSMVGHTIPAGRFALCTIGDAEVEEFILADPTGCNVVTMNVTEPTGIVEADLQMQMLKPYPNPFQNSVTIPYVVGSESLNDIQFLMTDITGRIIDRVQIGNQPRGQYTYVWSPKVTLSNGVYFVQMRANGMAIQTSKVVLNK